MGARVLREFSSGELEDYCIRRKRRDFLDRVIEQHDDLAIGAETLQVLSLLLAVMATMLWLLGTERLEIPLDWRQFATVAALSTLALLTVTQWIPLAVLRLFSAPFIYHTWWLWKGLRVATWPVAVGVSLVDSFMRRLAGVRAEETEEEAFEDEILSMVTTGEREGLLQADAREMIEGIIEMVDGDVSEIMTPRSRVDALDILLPLDEMVERAVAAGRTRLPVYERTLDSIIGILYVKDLLPILAARDNNAKSVRALLRTARFVPESKALNAMLQEFRRNRNHMAIVMDEYGAMAGVVTIEDVLEEIVGEIVDETDEEVADEIRQLDDTTAEIMGRAHLDEVNHRLALDLPEPHDYDTIGGFVIAHLGHIPQEKETISVDNVRITVLEATRRKVERVRLEILEKPVREHHS